MSLFSKFISVVKPLAIPAAAVFLCTAAVLCFLLIFEKKHTEKFNFKRPAAYGIGTVLIFAIGILLKLKGVSAASVENIQLCFEGFSWLAIILDIIFTFKSVKKKPCLPKLELFEWIIIAADFILGMAMVISLGFEKANYYDGINTFFNADLSRGVFSAISNTLPHTTHPCYRFAFLPVFAVINGVARIIAGSAYIMPGAYFVMALQCALNGASAVLVKRILQRLNVSYYLCCCASVVFCASFSCMWLDIFPETYSAACFLMLLGAYLHLCKNNLRYVFYIFAACVNPATAVFSAFLIFSDIIKQREAVINFICKKRTLFIFAAAVCAVAAVLFAIFAFNYILEWSSTELTFKGSIGYVIMPWLLAPEFFNLSPFFVQLGGVTLLKGILLAICAVAVIIALVKNKNSSFVWCCAAFLVVGVLLHGLFGFGRYNAVIYCGLYGWCVTVLVVCGVNSVLKNTKAAACVFLSAFAAVGIFVNVNWFLSIKDSVGNILNTDATVMEQQTVYYLSGCETGFYLEGQQLCSTEGECLTEEEFDGVVYCNNEKIWGLMADGSATVIYINKNEPTAVRVNDNF